MINWRIKYEYSTTPISLSLSLSLSTCLITMTEQQKIEIYPLSEQFESEGVTVTLELTELNMLYSYHVNAIPQLISHLFFGRKMVQLNVSYNVHYNVSVLAASPCGKNNVTTFSEIYYGEVICVILLKQ